MCNFVDLCEKLIVFNKIDRNANSEPCLSSLISRTFAFVHVRCACYHCYIGQRVDRLDLI